MLNIAHAMQTYADRMNLNSLEGSIETTIPGVRFYRCSTSSSRQPLVYQSGIIIVGQGRKVIHFPDHQIQYGAGDYLVVGVPMPLECEAFTDNGLPILGILIDVNAPLLHKLVSLLRQHQCYKNIEKKAIGVQSAALEPHLIEVCCRLLSILSNSLEAEVLGNDIVKELIYRVLCGPQGQTLIGLAQHDGHYARVAKALTTIHADYAEAITVENLAENVNMSVSSFHRAFKQVTFESPLQYLKKIRLVKAKELITINGRRANEAAHLVGYTSPSQFSREFKRHFNHSPSALAENLPN